MSDELRDAIARQIGYAINDAAQAPFSQEREIAKRYADAVLALFGVAVSDSQETPE